MPERQILYIRRPDSRPRAKLATPQVPGPGQRSTTRGFPLHTVMQTEYVPAAIQIRLTTRSFRAPTEPVIRKHKRTQITVG